jgi:hypothetical protein
MTVVRLDRQLWGRTALLTLLLTWPLILFGRPGYTSDSLSYFKGGRAAVNFAVGKIASQFHVGAVQSVAPPTNDKAISVVTPADTVGVRSIPYSVAAYLLSAPDAKMIVLVLAQACVTALTITIVALTLGVTELWAFIVLAVTVAVTTPVAWFAVFVMPDIFAGLAICIVALLATQFNRLSVGARLMLIAVGGFAVTSHASHPPLVAGMGLLGTGWIVLTRRPQQLRAITCLVAPLALGVALTAVSGFVAFNELSLAPKRWPLALARSVADGPARWFLEKNCGTVHYTVCEVLGNEIPGSVYDFLWGERGLRYRATPAQMDQIRAEEPEIVLKAAESYPYAEATLTLTEIARQLIHFGPGMAFDQRLRLDAAATPYLETTSQAHGWLYGIQALSIVSTLFGLGWACWRFPVLRGEQRAMLLLVVAGIVGNAIICAVFSGVTDRYQGRVIWVLPLVCMAMVLGTRKCGMAVALRAKGGSCFLN